MSHVGVVEVVSGGLGSLGELVLYPVAEADRRGPENLKVVNVWMLIKMRVDPVRLLLASNPETVDGLPGVLGAHAALPAVLE